MRGRKLSTLDKDAPKKKNARTNTRAILDTPEQSDAPPVRKNVGRKSQLLPIVDHLKENPDTWHIIAKGKKGTVSQTRSRLVALCSEVEAETHTDEDDADMAKCYARYVASK